MTEVEAIALIIQHLEGQFPKNCPNCQRRFDTLREFMGNTKPVGDMVSYDLEMGDLTPIDPTGTLTVSSCSCGHPGPHFGGNAAVSPVVVVALGQGRNAPARHDPGEIPPTSPLAGPHPRALGAVSLGSMNSLLEVDQRNISRPIVTSNQLAVRWTHGLEEANSCPCHVVQLCYSKHIAVRLGLSREVLPATQSGQRPQVGCVALLSASVKASKPRHQTESGASPALFYVNNEFNFPRSFVTLCPLFCPNSVTKPRGAGCKFGLSLCQPLKYG
jgi:hypothetical protein